MVDFDENECLKYDPFEGDFGSPSDVILKDKIGFARKSGECHICTHDIVKGEKIRMLTAVFDGTLVRYHWCSECCAAMAATWSDDFAALDERFSLRRE